MKQITDLIPCEDFVLKVSDYVFKQASFTDDEERLSIYSKGLSINHAYATLLKRELALCMFIPCNKEGNVLKDPELTMCQGDGQVYYSAEPKEFEEYQEAESRVLFKGFEIEYAESNNGIFGLYNKDMDLLIISESLGINRISDLVKHRLDLTDGALKQIYSS